MPGRHRGPGDRGPEQELGEGIHGAHSRRVRLRQPARLPEPDAPPDNPLGGWYADIDFLDREPFVVLLNAGTGAGMVLPGRAADLRALHVRARDQFRKLLLHYGFDPDSPQRLAASGGPGGGTAGARWSGDARGWAGFTA